MSDQDISEQLQERVRSAADSGQPLNIIGGNTKAFYGRSPIGEPLEVSGHRGIISYEPTELVITARGGTPLEEIETALAEQGQMLTFEPPRFAPGGTIGGAVASGLAGPRRPWGGAPRDLLLGVKLLDGQGRILNFGGQVMKNVAGYDVSRLMAGALGTLGVLLEVSLKVLPRPSREFTLQRTADADQALDIMEKVQRSPTSVTGACHWDGQLYLRVAASEATSRRLATDLGADTADVHPVWNGLRDHTLDYFTTTDTSLWRLSVPSATRTELVTEEAFIDWGGAQRWLHSATEESELRARATEAGGHATLFRGQAMAVASPFHPLSPPVAAFHKNLKQVFDPLGIINPKRMYTCF